MQSVLLQHETNQSKLVILDSVGFCCIFLSSIFPTFLEKSCIPMSENEKAIIKPEAMKPFIWLQCADGSIQQVEEEVVMFCPMIYREILQTGMGSSQNSAICLPDRVNPAILSLIFEYCRFHQVLGRSNKERKSFDEKFIRMDTKKLCELTSAADSLQLKPLVDLTSRALARMIEGKTPEEIRETFHLPDDLTEEEKLEPLKNVNDDPRIRLLNRLYAKKRKELKERQKLKDIEAEEEKKDERSVDEILSFINGEEDSKGVNAIKSKKKNRKKRDSHKDICGQESIRLKNKKEANFSPSASQCSDARDNDDDTFPSNGEFEDGDIDDLDPAVKEELDREVEDFARRLNSDWPERMQEFLSLGQNQKLVPNRASSHGSLHETTGMDRR
ncbi:SKP1-like protein 21 isoform X1 [Zingiber officinale]|uniref:SKP1-like protein 21 isoform X1 n=3 Tax=Zingiber officinale TaxID=94328 RepID=UPI001C4C68D2|nr:SKP1-like protein 21 isoform X1 [Zingiber officinale]XP_042429136.1 SKP1-like protein 21 isoform X1 [Zingiber officinale]